MKKILITGITGQDGSYLAELLLSKDYEVHGLIRRSSCGNIKNIEHIKNDIKLIYGDLTDAIQINNIISTTYYDEVYNLAAQSAVGQSFNMPEYTAQTNAIGVMRLLEAIQKYNYKTKFYQASTSELYGNQSNLPQNEETTFYPRSPYGISKLFGYWTTRMYREAYNIFAANGILYNHESERRGEYFVTKKITKAIARISKGLQDKIKLGNINAKRDWGYAKDYVEAMYLILQQDKPDDFIIATGETHSVKEFIEKAFGCIGINIVWDNSKEYEYGYDKNTSKILIEVDEKLLRPSDVNYLKGDATKALKILGWKPRTNFEQLIEIMMKYEMDNI
jgi:GDPmannose 4,6-dehydratase